MKITPQWNYCLLKRETMKSQLLEIPEDVQKNNAYPRGEVVSVGSTVEPSIAELVGHTVLFKRHGGDWLKDADGEEYFIVREDEILAKVEQ